MEKLTEQPLKNKIRNYITLNSVSKDQIRQEYNEIFDKLKEYEDKQEWISVEDRLPETDYKNTFDYNVLVYIPKREGCKQSGMFLGKVCKVEGDDGKRNFWNIKTEPCEWTVWGWSYFEHPVVTHWKPLPQPPKMKGTE